MTQSKQRRWSDFHFGDLAHGSLSAVLRGGLGLLRRMGFDYSCFRIYALSLGGTPSMSAPSRPTGYRFAELSPRDLSACPFPELRDSAWYSGQDSYAFGVFREDGALVCAQWFWFGERYRLQGFWPIERDEAVSMHLVTDASERGKGLATQIKMYSADRMRANGFSRLYSRVWWTNTPSIRMNDKAGWTNIGTILQISLPLLQKPLRFVHRRRSP